MKKLLWFLITNIFINNYILSSELALIRAVHRQDSTGKNQELYEDIKAHIAKFTRDFDDGRQINWPDQIDSYIKELVKGIPTWCVSGVKSEERKRELDEFKNQALKVISEIQELVRANYAVHRDQFVKALQDDNPTLLFEHSAEVSSLEPIQNSIRFLALNCLKEALSRNYNISCHALNDLSDVVVTDSNNHKVLAIIGELNAKSPLKSLCCSIHNIATLAGSKDNFGLIKLLLTIDRDLAFEKDATGKRGEIGRSLVELLSNKSNQQLLLDSGITMDEIDQHLAGLLKDEQLIVRKYQEEIMKLRTELYRARTAIASLQAEIDRL